MIGVFQRKLMPLSKDMDGIMQKLGVLNSEMQGTKMLAKGRLLSPQMFNLEPADISTGPSRKARRPGSRALT